MQLLHPQSWPHEQDWYLQEHSGRKPVMACQLLHSHSLQHIPNPSQMVLVLEQGHRNVCSKVHDELLSEEHRSRVTCNKKNGTQSFAFKLIFWLTPQLYNTSLVNMHPYWHGAINFGFSFHPTNTMQYSPNLAKTVSALITKATHWIQPPEFSSLSYIHNLLKNPFYYYSSLNVLVPKVVFFLIFQ